MYLIQPLFQKVEVMYQKVVCQPPNSREEEVRVGAFFVVLSGVCMPIHNITDITCVINLEEVMSTVCVFFTVSLITCFPVFIKVD